MISGYLTRQRHNLERITKVIELKIAITAFVLGALSWCGVNVFDDMEWEKAATACAFILTVCGMFFVVCIIMWIWGCN